jgi:hypothetical protein
MLVHHGQQRSLAILCCSSLPNPIVQKFPSPNRYSLLMRFFFLVANSQDHNDWYVCQISLDILGRIIVDLIEEWSQIKLEC